MRASHLENSIIGRIDKHRKRHPYVLKKNWMKDAPLAEKDCRECAYAKVDKLGAVRCSQKMWKDITVFRSVAAFTHMQRLAAMTCHYYHPMGDDA